MNKVQAHIHSLDGKLAEVTILQYNGDNNIIVEYNGIKWLISSKITQRRV